MEKLVIGACSNIDTIRLDDRTSRKFLNGASIYSGFAAAAITDTRVITCVGEEPENGQIVQKALEYRDTKIPKLDVITIKGGKSFRQVFAHIRKEEKKENEASFEVVEKDMGNYNDWDPKVPEFETDTLLLGTGNPIFQKAVLDSCRRANHILLDSKLIHLEKRADKVDALLKRVDTFFGTRDEIKQLLQNNDLSEIEQQALFKKYPNLQVIVEKNAGDGGVVYLKDGTMYRYAPQEKSREICTDGAGDVFAGTYAAAISEGMDIKESVVLAAQASAESVKHFGMNKVKSANISRDAVIRIEESRARKKDENSVEKVEE